MSDITKMYVRDGGSGKYYEIFIGDDGEESYLPAEVGLQFEEIKTRSNEGKLVGTGKYIEVSDLQERARQKEATSHTEYFKRLSENPDPKVAKRAMKKLDAFTAQFERLNLDRVSPVGVPKVTYLKDEQFMDMHAKYEADAAKGIVDDPDYKENMFVPLSAYASKLITKSGKQVRPMYKGEVGMRGAEIFCLEAGYGIGNSVSVSEKIGSGPRGEEE